MTPHASQLAGLVSTWLAGCQRTWNTAPWAWRAVRTPGGVNSVAGRGWPSLRVCGASLVLVGEHVLRRPWVQYGPPGMVQWSAMVWRAPWVAWRCLLSLGVPTDGIADNSADNSAEIVHRLLDMLPFLRCGGEDWAVVQRILRGDLGRPVPREDSAVPGPRPAARGRPFSADNPGSRTGRPRGSRNKTTIACQDLLDGEGEAITAKAVELAKSGDTVALRLVIDRVLPKTRGRAVEIELPRLVLAADLVEACAAVVEAAAAGDLTLGEAREFMALLDSQRRAIESQDLAVRVELLEAQFKGVRT